MKVHHLGSVILAIGQSHPADFYPHLNSIPLFGNTFALSALASTLIIVSLNLTPTTTRHSPLRSPAQLTMAGGNHRKLSCLMELGGIC